MICCAFLSAKAVTCNLRPLVLTWQCFNVKAFALRGRAQNLLFHGSQFDWVFSIPKTLLSSDALLLCQETLLEVCVDFLNSLTCSPIRLSQYMHFRSTSFDLCSRKKKKKKKKKKNIRLWFKVCDTTKRANLEVGLAEA